MFITIKMFLSWQKHPFWSGIKYFQDLLQNSLTALPNLSTSVHGSWKSQQTKWICSPFLKKNEWGRWIQWYKNWQGSTPQTSKDVLPRLSFHRHLSWTLLIKKVNTLVSSGHHVENNNSTRYHDGWTSPASFSVWNRCFSYHWARYFPFFQSKPIIERSKRHSPFEELISGSLNKWRIQRGKCLT